MKKLILIIISFAFLIPCMSRDQITISGQVKTIGNPCLSEECPPGVVWAIETDTAPTAASLIQVACSSSVTSIT